MPFTLAHPAASVPLAKRGLNLSALIFGSLAPDLWYFLTLTSNQDFSHTLPGLFLFCLPVGFALLWVYHRLLKRPLLALLPDSHQQRLAPFAGPYAFLPLRRTGWIVLSLLVGALTHQVWDAFTHVDGWVVQHVPFFFILVFSADGSYFQVFKVLQYLSSIFGVVVLGIWYVQWYQKARPQPDPALVPIPEWARWLIVGVMCLLALEFSGFLTILRGPAVDSLYTLRIFVVRLLVTGISSLGVEAVLFALLWNIISLKRAN